MTRRLLHLLQRCDSLRLLRQIHAHALARGLLPLDQHLSCKILNTYARLDRPGDARFLCLQIPAPDAVTLTSLMSLHIQTDGPAQAIQVFSDMLRSGMRPDGVAAVTALSAASQLTDVGLGRAIHGIIYRGELGKETIVNNVLIDMYCRSGSFGAACLVFDVMATRDEVSWSSMLHGHVKCRGLKKAENFFDEMPLRDVGCWTVMITGYTQGGFPVKALELFKKMHVRGHRPNTVTFVGVLSACAAVGALDVGRLVHGCIFKTNSSPNNYVYNSLLDMYSKSGRPCMAAEVFKEILNKDIYTWTTMISGFAINGNGWRVIEVFKEMLRSEVRPNQTTFVSVLLACSHCGLVEEGQHWFEEMTTCFSLDPTIEHYGCMVDLLGRAGLLRKAEKLIEGMSMKPDVVIWRSLLSASLVHGDGRLADIAGKQILELQPDDDGVYVLLWNMYAHSKRWKEALETRKLMRSRRVVKTPGYSWIEVNGTVHEFLVEDSTHHMRNVLYSVIEGLEMQMKKNTDLYIEWSDKKIKGKSADNN